MIRNRSHTMSCIVWACYLYPLAIAALSAAGSYIQKVSNSYFVIQALLIENKLC